MLIITITKQVNYSLHQQHYKITFNRHI